jgi:eyes absent family protein 1
MSFLSTVLIIVLSRMQIENYNEPYLNALREYDDGRELTKYDFEADCFSSPYDDVNKRKLAYRHRAIGEKYAKVSR